MYTDHSVPEVHKDQLLSALVFDARAAAGFLFFSCSLSCDSLDVEQNQSSVRLNIKAAILCLSIIE